MLCRKNKLFSGTELINYLEAGKIVKEVMSIILNRKLVFIEVICHNSKEH